MEKIPHHEVAALFAREGEFVEGPYAQDIAQERLQRKCCGADTSPNPGRITTINAVLDVLKNGGGEGGPRLPSVCSRAAR